MTITKRWLLISQYQIGKAHHSSVGCFKNIQLPGSTKSGKEEGIPARVADPGQTTESAFLFPCNSHGMFSCYSIDKNFLSLLALTHVFLFFVWKHAFPCYWPPIPRAQPNVQGFQRNVQSSLGTQSLHKTFPKDPKWLAFPKTHTPYKIRYFFLWT